MPTSESGNKKTPSRTVGSTFRDSVAGVNNNARWNVPIGGDRKRKVSRLALAWLMAFLSVTSAAFSIGSSPEPHVLWAASFSLGFYLLFLLVIASPAEEIWCGLTRLRTAAWVLLYGSFTFGFATVLMINNWDLSRRVVDLDYVRPALFMIGIAYTAMVIGYRMHYTKSNRTDSISFEMVTPASVFGVWTVGILALTAFTLGSGGYGYLGSPVVTEDSVGPLTQPLLALSTFRHVALGWAVYMALTSSSVSYRYLIAIIASANTLIAVFAGMREEFIMLGIAALLPYLLVRRRLPILRLLLAAIVFLLVLTPFVSQVRSIVRDGDTSLSVQEAVAGITDSIRSGTAIDDRASVEESASRFALSENVAVILEATPARIPYRDIDELVSAPFVGLVPRAVWPDKPVSVSGQDFYREYWLGRGLSSSAVTVPGSLLMYGGVGVLAAGMFLFGLGLRVFDEFHIRRGGLISVLSVMIVFDTVVKQEASVVSILRAIPIFVFLYFLASFLVKSHRPLVE